jgi:hypothetical protein
MDEIPIGEVQMENEADKLNCMNCSKEVSERFCSHCGQDSRQFQQPVWKIMGQFGASLFDVDGKILKSLAPLLLKPGKLTQDFLDGRRRSQLNPFQLYAFFSFLFFLTAFQLPETDLFQSKPVEIEKTRADTDTTRLSFQVQKAWKDVFKSSKSRGLVQEYDSIQNSLPYEERDSGISLFVKQRLNIFGDRLEKDVQVFDELLENMKNNIPNSLILLLPIFALILKLLYIRKSYFYVDHLVFSIHLFSFLFLLGAFTSLFGTFLPESIIAVLLLSIPVYFIVAMRRVFGQSWLKTTFKYFLATFSFVFIAFAGLMLNFFIALLFQS